MVVQSLSEAETADGQCAAASLTEAAANGYKDIALGTQVSVYNGGSDLLAVSELQGGRLSLWKQQEVPDYSKMPQSPAVPGTDAPQSEWDAWNKANAEYLDAIENLPKKTVYWGYCKFDFTVDVPVSEFYAVEVAHRGKVNFSSADVEAAGWHVDLSLGS